MARTPDGPVARTEKISLRVTKSTAAALDRQRGTDSRSDHIRKLIVRADAPNRKKPQDDAPY